MDDIKKILDLSIQRSINSNFKGYDPAILESLPFSKKYIRNSTSLNGWLRKMEKILLYFIPLDWYVKKTIKVNPFQSVYGDALYIQAFCLHYKILKDDRILQIAKDLAFEATTMLVPTENGLAVPNPPEIRDFKSLVKNSSASTGYLPGSAEFIFALLDLYDLTNDVTFLSYAKDIAAAFSKDFNLKKTHVGGCLDYSTSGDSSHVLNANALAAAALCRVGKVAQSSEYDDIIESIYNYLQYYVLKYDMLPYSGEEDEKIIPKKSRLLHDVYHTGFTLRGLNEIYKYLGKEDSLLNEKVNKYFYTFVNKENRIIFSNSSGFHRNLVDSHGVAEYIYMYSIFKKQLTDNVFIENIIDSNIRMLARENHFLYRKLGFLNIDAYFPRWTEAPMIKSIISYLS